MRCCKLLEMAPTLVFLANTVLYTKLVCSSRSFKSLANGRLSPNNVVKLGSARLMTVGNSFRNSSNLAEVSIYDNLGVDQGNLEVALTSTDAQRCSSHIMHRYKQSKGAAEPFSGGGMPY